MDRPRSGPTLIEVHTGGSRREGQCEDMFRPQGRIRTTLEPLRSKDLHEGAGCTLPFERVPPGFSIGLLARGECQGFPVCPHTYSLDSAQGFLTASSSTGPEGPVQPMHRPVAR